MLEDLYTNPEMATACLDRLYPVKTEIARRMAKYGVDVIVYGDDVSMQTGMMMSPAIWRKFPGTARRATRLSSGISPIELFRLAASE